MTALSVSRFAPADRGHHHTISAPLLSGIKSLVSGFDHAFHVIFGGARLRQTNADGHRRAQRLVLEMPRTVTRPAVIATRLAALGPGHHEHTVFNIAAQLF